MFGHSLSWEGSLLEQHVVYQCTWEGYLSENGEGESRAGKEVGVLPSGPESWSSHGLAVFALPNSAEVTGASEMLSLSGICGHCGDMDLSLCHQG